MKKVTINLPNEQAAAIALFLGEQEKGRAIRRYEEGYRKYPEGVDAMAYAKATAAALGRERWA